MPQDRKKKQAKKFGSVKKRVPELINPETTPPGPSRAVEVENVTETSEPASLMPEYGEDCFSDLIDLELNTLARAFRVGSVDHAESSELASSVQIPWLRSVLEPGKKDKAWSSTILPAITNSSRYATSPTYSPIASPTLNSLDLGIDIADYESTLATEMFEQLRAVAPEKWEGFTVQQAFEKLKKAKTLPKRFERFLTDSPIDFKGVTLQQAFEVLRKGNGKESNHHTSAMPVFENGVYQALIKHEIEISATIPENRVVSQGYPDQEGVDTHSLSHNDHAFAMKLCIEMIHCRPALRNNKGPAVDGLYNKVLDAIRDVRAAGIPKQDQLDEIRRRLKNPYDKAALIAAAGITREEDEIAQHLIETHGPQRVLDVVTELQATGIPEQYQQEEIRKRLENPEEPDDSAALKSEGQIAKTTPEEENLGNRVSNIHNPTHGLNNEDAAFAVQICGELILRHPELDRESVPLTELLLDEVIETIEKVRATAVPKRVQQYEIMERLVEIFDQAAVLVEESVARYARGEPAPSNENSNTSPVPSGNVTQPSVVSSEGSDSSDETTIAVVFDTWWMMVKTEVKEKAVRLGVLHKMPKSMEVLEYRKAMNDVMASAPASSGAEDPFLGAEGQGKPLSDTAGATSEDPMSSADRPYLPNIWLDSNIPRYPRKPFTPIVYKSDDVPMLRPIQRFTPAQRNAVRAATAKVEKKKELEKDIEVKEEEKAKKKGKAKKK